MTSRERFEKAMNYQTPDRPVFGHLIWQPYAFESFLEYLHTDVAGYDRLLEKDMVGLYPPYIGRELKVFPDGRYEDMWGTIYDRLPKGARITYEEAVYQPLAGIETVEEMEKYPFPTADMFDYSKIKSFCREYDDKVICIGSLGGLDFMNGIGYMRGQEQVYLDVGLEDEAYLCACRKRFEFTYEWYERMLKEGGGRIDLVLVGDDLGTQTAPLISMDKFNRLFSGYYKQIFALAHKYGARTMMHSCGSIVSFIDRLIELGLDVLEGVQVDAAGMDIRTLHKRFFKRIAFCGTMSVQTTLCSGTPEGIVREVELRKELFHEGGLMLGPSNILQGDMLPENLAAMCRALGVLKV
jgi:uroporphyrinogen decarboxylase